MSLLLLMCVPVAWAQDAETLRRQVEAGEAFSQPDMLRRFYQERGYEQAWIADGRATPSAVVLARALRVAEQEGLDPNAVHRSSMEKLLESVRTTRAIESPAQIKVDLHLTDAFLHYGTFLIQGRVDPQAQHSGWNLTRRHADLVALLEAALQANAIETTLAHLEPPYRAYGRLKQALASYHRLAEQGGWGRLASGSSLRIGDTSDEVQALRERLRITGDLTDIRSDSLDHFDATLDRAVRAFQRRHGLEEDGIVGNNTRAALNVPVETRIRQIVLNLERLRWLPEDLGSRYVLINIAGYSLRVVEGDAAVLAMRVIVGTPRTRTPVFSTRLTEVVLAPYWNVPTSIAQNEILPRVRRDPGYLSRNHMKILAGGRIRQDPGPTNPLGRLKFTITNRYGVGLHDTPARHLFAESVCAFSHGCIRAERPLDLAVYLLRNDTTWTQERMNATIERWQETRIPAPEPLPVHVLYWTAWVDDQGILHLRPDIYGHDDRLDRAL
jgi:murein L,D-transpeptidase YcbB/YkuD